MSNLWERQPCDDDESWPAFVTYRDKPPPRKSYGHPAGSEKVRQWYEGNMWRERVAAYDAHVDARRLKVVEEEREKALRASAKDTLADNLVAINMTRELFTMEIRKFHKASMDSGPDGLPVLKAGELTKMLDTAVKLGLLVSGQATERMEVKNELDYSLLTPQERQAMAELIMKATKKS